MLEQLFDNNQSWAQAHKNTDATYFEELSKGQSPEYLWLGCADSRVPAESLLGLEPGQLFVHRNVANQVRLDDDNCMSVLQYSVTVLKVKHIIVCGHTSCGGVKATLDNAGTDYLASWLSELKQVELNNQAELDACASDDDKLNALIRLNVLKQMDNIANHDIVKSAWESGQELHIHGLVFDIATGLLQDLGTTISK